MTQFIARTERELPSAAHVLSMSGLEFMRGILAGTISAAPIAGLMNYRLDSVEEGYVAFCATPEFEVTNPVGTVHGGWYGTLLDSCMACAVMTMVPKGSIYTTLEYKVNITRPVPLGTEVIATGRIQHAGRSTGVANGEIRGADSVLYATGSTTCNIMTPG